MPFPFFDILAGLVFGGLLLIALRGLVEGVWKSWKKEDAAPSNLGGSVALALCSGVPLGIYVVIRVLLAN